MMQKVTSFIYFSLLSFLLLLMSCDQIKQNTEENNAEDPALKAKLVSQVAELGCQDIRDFVTQYGGKLLPVVGDVLLDKIIDKKGKGNFCDCLKPTLESELNTEMNAEELDKFIVERENRRKFVKSVVLDQRKDIMDCYKSKGSGKGVKFIEKIINKIAKKEAGDQSESKEDNTLE